MLGLTVRGSLQVMLSGWREVKPGLGGQCVLGDQAIISRFSWRGSGMDEVGDGGERVVSWRRLPENRGFTAEA